MHCQYGLGIPVIELDLIIVKSKSLKILWIGFFKAVWLNPGCLHGFVCILMAAKRKNGAKNCDKNTVIQSNPID